MQENDSTVQHIPVLADELIERIDLPQDGVMVDATIGHGGHSLLFGNKLGPQGILIGFDFDSGSLDNIRSKLEKLTCKVILLHSNFSQITSQLADTGVSEVDFILADLGISSGQLADSDMGLSFQTDMPLDMRIDKRIETTAADIVNGADENALADLIYEFGEERGSRRIARFIVEQRQKEPITTTGRLSAIVVRALKGPGNKKWQRLHPATRTFQALRIAVNGELDSLDTLLSCAPAILKTGGCLAVISFHSLEDRRVKLDFKKNKENDVYTLLTKKPITASPEEVDRNPRARSAKLRIARKR